MTFPRHTCGLYLTHNQHRNVYQNAQEWLGEEDRNHPDLYTFPPGERQRCIETGEIWSLQWYPDTPIGFYVVSGATLEMVLSEANRIQAEADALEHVCDEQGGRE